MKIYRSCQNNWITQKFGDNTEFYKKNFNMDGHNGLDFAVFPCVPDIWSKEAKCQPIYWDCDIEGEVYKLGTDKNIGFGVWVNTKNEDGFYKHRFWHLSKIECVVGQKLGTGDLIGLGGNTGLSTGSHLHRDLTPLNEDGTQKLAGNGYDGCIDLTPYFENIWVVDKMRFLEEKLSLLTKLLNMLKLLLGIKV